MKGIGISRRFWNASISDNQRSEQAIAPDLRQTDGVLSHQRIDAGGD